MILVKETKNNGKLVFKEIEYSIAKEMMLNNHYSKKWNTSFGKINIGVFKDDVLLGAAVFGNLMNPNSYKKVNNTFEKGEFIELNRMWIDDKLTKNAESCLISSSMKLIKKLYPNIRDVQSFADGRLGCGTIYKATNFDYYGFTESLFFENIKTGEVLHKVPLENTKRPIGFIGKNIPYLLGDLKTFKVKTYKYIFWLDKRAKKYSSVNSVPYPEYDKGTTDVTFKHPIGLLARLYLMIQKVDPNSVHLENISNRFTDDEFKSALNEQLKNKSLQWFFNEYITTEKNLNTIKELIK